MDEDENSKRVRMVGVFVTLPFVLAVPPVIGWLIGSWIDNYLDTSNFFMFLFIILGFVAGAREFYRILTKYTRSS